MNVNLWRHKCVAVVAFLICIKHILKLASHFLLLYFPFIWPLSFIFLSFRFCSFRIFSFQAFSFTFVFIFYLCCENFYYIIIIIFRVVFFEDLLTAYCVLKTLTRFSHVISSHFIYIYIKTTQLRPIASCVLPCLTRLASSRNRYRYRFLFRFVLP